MSDDKFVHSSGATSSRLDDRYDLIPFAALQAMARRFGIGAVKHGPDNWKKGDASYARERLNHLWQHLAAFTEHGKQEDLDAIICNAAMLCDMKARGLMPEELPQFVLIGKHDPVYFKIGRIDGLRLFSADGTLAADVSADFISQHPLNLPGYFRRSMAGDMFSV